MSIVELAGKLHLQNGEWERILRLALVSDAEDPTCAILRACPRLLVQVRPEQSPKQYELLCELACDGEMGRWGGRVKKRGLSSRIFLRRTYV